MYKFRDYQNLALAGSLILAGFGIWYVINDILSDPIIFQSSRSDLRLANADQIYGFWKIVALNRNGEIEREDSLFMMTGNSEQYLEFMKEDYASNLLELQK